MVAKKVSGKSKKRSTSMAMSDILNRQKKNTKAIEKMLSKNIAAEISTRHIKEFESKPLSDIAVDVAARRRAKSRPKKAKLAPKEKKTPAKVRVKATQATVKKPSRPAARKPATKASREKLAPIEIVTLGAGLFKMVGVAVGGLFDAGRALTGFVSSGVTKAAKSVESGAKSAKEKVSGAVKSVKRGPKAKSKRRKADEQGAVTAAMKTAKDATGKVAGGMLSVGSGVGKVAGYVVTGALAAPVDIVNGVIGIGASATGSISRLLFCSPKPKRSKSGKRRRIPVI